MQGFTLIELSVVLAIIGLVAGGILGTRSYLRNAELVSAIEGAQQYLVAAQRFQTQYAELPGDMNSALSVWSTAAGNGDGDGVIGSTNAEFFLAFNHLMKANLIKGQFTGVAGGSGSLDGDRGINLPALPGTDTSGYLQSAAGGFITGNTAFFDGLYDLTFTLGREQSGNALPTNGFVAPADAQQLDRKFDDGMPATGAVRTFKGVSGCVDGTTYDISSTSVACRFLISTH